MNRIIILSILSMFSLELWTQEKLVKKEPQAIQVIFNSGETKLSTKNKKILDLMKVELLQGKEFWIYPVTTFDKKEKSKLTSYTNIRKSDEVWFDMKSSVQANEIIAYLETKNYKNIIIDNEFLSPLRGPSIRLSISRENYFEQEVEESKKNIVKQKKKSGKVIPLKDYYPEKKSQFFTINPQKDTLIIGEEGTKLFFSPGTLLCNDLVQIELKEYYKSSDFIKADLQTVSDGKLLYTGGTIYLDARKQSDLDSEVKINPSRGINVEFSEGKNDPEMKLFLKDKSSKETNWKLDKKRKWKYTLVYKLSLEEDYKSFVFNSPNDYQYFISSGEAKKVKEEVYSILKDRLMKKREEEYRILRAEEEKRQTEIRKNDETVSRLLVNELGFINCDKFYDKETEEFQILADKTVKAQYYMIFKGEKGILKGYENGENAIRFGKVPVNQGATIIGISMSKKKYLYTKQINSINETIGRVVLTEATENEIEEALMAIND